MEILIGVIFALLIFFVTYGKEIVKDLKIRLLFAFGLTGILIYLKQIMAISAELASIIVVLIIAAGNSVHSFVKSYADNKYKKKNEKELSNRDIILTDSLRDLETIVIGVEQEVKESRQEVKELRQETDFERVLRNSITSKGAQIVNLNYGLNDNAKNIVTFVTRQIESLAFLFYYSPYRNNHDEMEIYLRTDVNEKRAKACTFIDSVYKPIKVYGNKKYKLSTFLDDFDTLKGIDDKYLSCNTIMELLLIDLSKNGYNKEKTIKEFTKFLTKYLKSLIKTINIFNDLKDV